MIADEARNDLIFDDVLCALEAGRSPVVITERTARLETFAKRLERFARHVIVLRGGVRTEFLHPFARLNLRLCMTSGRMKHPILASIKPAAAQA